MAKVNRTLLAGCLALALAGGAWAQEQQASEAKAAQLLDRIERMVNPKAEASRMTDAAYFVQYQSDVRKVIRQRSDLIAEFYKNFPEHPRVGDLLERRWSDVEALIEKPADLPGAFRSALEEIDFVLSRPPIDAPLPDVMDWPPVQVRIPALYWRAVFRIKLAGDAITTVLEEARSFAKAAPEAPDRAIGLLAQAGFSARRPQDAAAAYREILERWPTYPQAPVYRGLLRQIEAVGSKLPLSFADVLKGTKIELAQLEGSVVVIDFFSTTLGASASRLATLKMLRSELGEKGLIVIGVCMDDDKETSDAKIKEWAAQHRVDWPIEWSGARVKSSWIEGWGVLAVPGMFVLDRRGLIRYTSAPNNLKGELEKLLKEKN